MIVDAKAMIILSKNYRSWGSFFFDAKDDALHITTQLVDFTDAY